MRYISSKARRLLYALGSAVLAALFLSLLFSLGVFSNVNVRLTDNLYGGGVPLREIVVVGIDDDSLQSIGRWPWNRSIFAEMAEVLQGAKVVGIDIGFFETSVDDEQVGLILESADNLVLGAEYIGFETELEILLPVWDTAYGYVNIPLDKDGVNRRVSLNLGGRESFAQAVYTQRFGKAFKFGDELLVNFLGPPGTFERYSFAEVLDGSVDLTGKIVLIGATSPGFHDDYLVPTSEGTPMPGVEVHANILQTIITRNFVFQQTAASVILTIFVISLISSLIWYFLPVRISTIILAAGVTLYIVAAILMFSRGRIWNLIYPPLAIILTYLVITLVFYLTEKREKKEAITAFSKYVSPDVVKEITQHPERLKLGGERKRITILFSDIRSFTSISEKMTPEELVNVLNEYLTEMADLIMEKKGLVDKFIGDAIMALWGVPLPEKEHAKLACEAALLMKEKVKNHDFQIGIGLNTGEAVVGNIGSHQRFDYTAIGDSINLASRVEGLTKEYGIGILITESTKELIGNEFITRKIDLVAVKGKKEPVWIYELVCKRGEPHDAFEHFEKGLHFYLKKEWDKAIAEFKQGSDKASELFVQRCQDFKKNVPPPHWDGVFEMKKK